MSSWVMFQRIIFIFDSLFVCTDSKEWLHQAHQAVQPDDRVQANRPQQRSSLAEGHLPRFQVSSSLPISFMFYFFWNSMPSKNISGYNWYIWLKVIKSDFLRIFDINNDGFIDKKEFRWMTTSNVISPEVIQTVFQVVYKLFFCDCRVIVIIFKCFVFWLKLSCYPDGHMYFNQNFDIIQRCDKDRNGKLDFKEFHEMITRWLQSTGQLLTFWNF